MTTCVGSGFVHSTHLIQKALFGCHASGYLSLLVLSKHEAGIDYVTVADDHSSPPRNYKCRHPCCTQSHVLLPTGTTLHHALAFS